MTPELRTKLERIQRECAKIVDDCIEGFCEYDTLRSLAKGTLETIKANLADYDEFRRGLPKAWIHSAQPNLKTLQTIADQWNL